MAFLVISQATFGFFGFESESPCALFPKDGGVTGAGISTFENVFHELLHVAISNQSRGFGVTVSD